MKALALECARLKLPAYGKRLLLERRAGRHPSEVTLVYGDQWWEAQHPKICIRPEAYDPGKYDLRMVAGCKVVVLDQLLCAALDFGGEGWPPIFGKFFDLLHEVAAAGAYVEITWPSKVGWPARHLSEYAWAARWYDRAAQRMQWPRWWNDELAAQHDARWQLWFQDRAVECGLTERERGAAA